jgi:hypothetical protein
MLISACLLFAYTSVHVRQTSMARFIVAVLATLLAVASAKPAIDPPRSATKLLELS